MQLDHRRELGSRHKPNKFDNTGAECSHESERRQPVYCQRSAAAATGDDDAIRRTSSPTVGAVAIELVGACASNF